MGLQFTDEKSCRLHFKEQRDKQGVICKRCGAIDHSGWLINGFISVSILTPGNHYAVAS